MPTATLNHAYVDRLTADGFRRIGHFSIEGPVFSYQIEVAEARSWLFSIYAWVSFEAGGTIMRIGKSEGELARRIHEYQNSLNTLANHIMSGRLGPNTCYSGDTRPWELEGWRGYTVPFDGGLIFAKQLPPQHHALHAKRALEIEELRLIRTHNPPLNGTSRAGRARRKEWTAINGPAIAVSKRTGLPDARKST